MLLFHSLLTSKIEELMYSFMKRNLGDTLTWMLQLGKVVYHSLSPSLLQPSETQGDSSLIPKSKSILIVPPYKQDT